MPIGGTAFLGQNQSPRLTTTYLNQLGRTGDPAPGVNVSTAQISGSIVQPYSGFCGGKLTITDPWAPQFADPAVGPLYGGVYQYVQFLSPGPTTPPTRGAICFWADELNYVVTPAYNANTAYKTAGVIVNNTTPGNWDFIQIGGIAMALFNAALAIGALAQANIAVTPPAPSGVNSATAYGTIIVGSVVLQAGVSGQVSPLQLALTAGWNY